MISRQSYAHLPPHERPAVHYDHALSTWIFRAYSLGSCPLKLALIATGRLEQFSQSSLDAFAAGHEHEAIVKFRLRERGFLISDEQRDLELNLGSAIIRGHWDGEVAHSDFSKPIPELHDSVLPLISSGYDLGPCVLEVKSMREEDYMSFLARGLSAFPAYEYQVSYYSYVSRLPILFAAQCKSDLAIAYRYYPTPPLDISAVIIKVSKVLAFIADLESGGRPLCVDYRAEKFRCPFEDVHDQGIESAPTLELTNPELEAAAESYLELSRRIKELETQKADFRERLKLVLDESPADKIRAGAYSWQNITTTSKDYASLLRDHPDFAALLPDYERKSSYLRIDGPRKKG